jgi:hypothetical protein
MAEQACRIDACVVDDEEVPRGQQTREIGHRMVGGLTCASVELEQTGPTAFRDRLLRDQLRREIVVEV